MRLVLVAVSLITGSHVCWGFTGCKNPVEAYDSDTKEAIRRTAQRSPDAALISLSALKEEHAALRAEVASQQAWQAIVNTGIANGRYRPLTTADEKELDRLNRLDLAGKPHGYDRVIAHESALLYNLFQRYFANDMTQQWSGVPSDAEAKERLLEAARRKDEGGETKPWNVAPTWEELVKRRLTYNETREQSWSRAYAVQNWLLPMSVWLGIHNNDWPFMNINPTNDALSAIYTGLFLHVLSAVYCRVNNSASFNTVL